MALSSIYIISDMASSLPELAGGARQFADKVTAFVFGGSDAAQAAAGCGADRIVYCPLAETGSPEDYAKPIAEEIRKDASACVFVSNTILGRCLAGKLGVYLDTAVFTNVSDLAVENGAIAFSRTVYGGAAARRISAVSPYTVLTLNGGAFEPDAAAAPTSVIEEIQGAPAESLNRISRDEKRETAVNLTAAKRIVDVGRGLAAEADLEMCRKLASVLGAEVGCSRPVAENNKWLPKNVYMGITGVQVKPDLLLAIGLSGQIQHIGGINKSRFIVAVNKDKSAPIFKSCDFGLVGDLYKVLPLLIDKLS